MTNYPCICPRCEQGPCLNKSKIKGIDGVLFICSECDALWTNESAISKKPEHDFSTYLRSFGIDPITAMEEILSDE